MNLLHSLYTCRSARLCTHGLGPHLTFTSRKSGVAAEPYSGHRVAQHAGIAACLRCTGPVWGGCPHALPGGSVEEIGAAGRSIDVQLPATGVSAASVLACRDVA